MHAVAARTWGSPTFNPARYDEALEYKQLFRGKYMDHWISLTFLAVGIILAVTEMATLTFYLAGLSFAALVTALYSWVYSPDWWQAAIVFALAAVIALPLAHLLRRRMQMSRNNSSLDDMDKGAQVTVAEDSNGNLKVKYRDSLWEAVWEGDGQPKLGARAQVVAREGSRLHIKAID
ncbi:MAG: NfeD family protein [Gammaproteobacteria bacterium]|nr:NfeD family protein [Gammaproteobacteria bacterium]